MDGPSVTPLSSKDTIKRLLSSEGLSDSQTSTFLGLINVYIKNNSELEVMKLLPVLKNKSDTLGTSLGGAVDYMTGKDKAYHRKYNQDMFFSIIGLHFMLCEICVQSRSRYPAVFRAAEKLLISITSNNEAMNSIEFCIQTTRDSSIGAIDVFCPLLSIIVESRTRPVEESYKAYQATLLKGPLRPVFYMKKDY